MQSPHSSISNWRVLPLTIADQQQHIERSEQLLSTVSLDEPPTLYWSQAERVGLVLGYSQKLAPPRSRAEASSAPTIYEGLAAPEVGGNLQEIPIYQRRAGGTAVLVGSHLLGLDVVLPAGHPLVLPDIVESYRWLGEAWVKALRFLGIETRTVSPEEAHAQGGRWRSGATVPRERARQASSPFVNTTPAPTEMGTHERARARQASSPHIIPAPAPTGMERESVLRRACFGALSPYEVVVGGRKVVGLDMIRRRAGSLLQAGVLLHWETELLAQLLGHTAEEQAILREGLLERAVGIDTLAGRVVTSGEVIEAFERVIFAM